MLREVQRTFADALFADEGEEAGIKTAAAQIHAGKLNSERRLEIYRHNVLTNLRGALGDIFPVVKRIVGDVFFLHAADRFILANPSRSGDLNQFGGEWPDFIAAYRHAAELPYLADEARLEWAWHECFHAAEAEPLDLARLATIPPEVHGELADVRDVPVVEPRVLELDVGGAAHDRLAHRAADVRIDRGGA